MKIKIMVYSEQWKVVTGKRNLVDSLECHVQEPRPAKTENNGISKSSFYIAFPVLTNFNKVIDYLILHFHGLWHWVKHKRSCGWQQQEYQIYDISLNYQPVHMYNQCHNCMNTPQDLEAVQSQESAFQLNKPYIGMNKYTILIFKADWG